MKTQSPPHEWLEGRAILAVALLGVVLFLLVPVVLEAGCPVAPEKVRFPPEVYLFHGVVDEPVLEGSVAGEWVVRIRVLEAIHLPESLAVFDVVPQKLDENCDPAAWTREEMIDGFAAGDEVKVSAFPTGHVSPLGSPFLISSPTAGLVILAGRAVGSVVEVRDSYDYLWALHRMEKELDDIKKVGTLTAISRWVEDSEAFLRLLEAQLDQKRHRKQLLGIHDSYHAARRTSEDQQP